MKTAGRIMNLSKLPWTAMCKRLWIAICWTIHVQVKAVVIRRRLAAKVAADGSPSAMVPIEHGKLLRSSLQSLTKAVRPAYQSEVNARFRRQRHILSRLRALENADYAVSTAAGRRVFCAALARCVSSICDQSVTAAQLQSIPCELSLTTVLIRWLERSEFARSTQALFPTAVSISSAARRDEAVTHHVVATDPNHDLKQENRMKRQMAFEQIAEQELCDYLAEQEFKLLALPSAILHAYQSRHENRQEPSDVSPAKAYMR